MKKEHNLAINVSQLDELSVITPQASQNEQKGLYNASRGALTTTALL